MVKVLLGRNPNLLSFKTILDLILIVNLLAAIDRVGKNSSDPARIPFTLKFCFIAQASQFQADRATPKPPFEVKSIYRSYHLSFFRVDLKREIIDPIISENSLRNTPLLCIDLFSEFNAL